MPGWSEIASYSAPLTLLAGVLMALAIVGVGRIVCFCVRAHDFKVLRVPVELLIGVLVISSCVQLLAMSGVAHRRVLEGIAWALLLPAGWVLRDTWRALGDLRRVTPTPSAPLPFWLPAIVMVVTLLGAAVAPESRSDESSYHALVGARIIADGGLHFYALPWEATVLPQMIWHYALVPLQTVAGAAPAGVVSACAALILAGTVTKLVHEHTADLRIAAVSCFAVLAGGYAVVFFTTIGPHAFQSLATVTAGLAVCWRNLAPRREWMVAIAVSCAAMVASKATMAPLAVLIAVVAFLDAYRETRSLRAVFGFASLVFVITLSAVGPLMVWGFVASGSPLGSLTAQAFHAVRFDAEALDAYEGTRTLFASLFLWRFELAYWNVALVFCAGVALAISHPAIQRTRLWLLVGCQTLVIVMLLPKEIRHLGGLQYLLFASGIVALVGRWQIPLAQRWLAIVGIVAVAPWGALTLWVSSIYAPLLAGQQSPRAFLAQYAGLSEDWERLDRLLPQDARVLIGRSRTDARQYAWYARPPIYYFPRRVFFHTAELEAYSGRAYLLYLGEGSDGSTGTIPFDPRLPTGWTLQRSVYSNDAARFFPSRTPNGAGAQTRLEVFELARASRTTEGSQLE